MLRKAFLLPVLNVDNNAVAQKSNDKELKLKLLTILDKVIQSRETMIFEVPIKVSVTLFLE